MTVADLASRLALLELEAKDVVAEKKEPGSGLRWHLYYDSKLVEKPYDDLTTFAKTALETFEKKENLETIIVSSVDVGHQWRGVRIQFGLLRTKIKWASEVKALVQ